MSAPPLFPGLEVTLAGVQYTLPPLSFGAYKRQKERLRQIAEGGFSDPVQLQDALTDVVHAALQRNYPDLPRETVEDALDWATADQLFGQVMQVSMPQLPPGETRAASPSGESTGT